MRKISMALSRKALNLARENLVGSLGGAPLGGGEKIIKSHEALDFVRKIKQDSINKGLVGSSIMSMPLEGVKTKGSPEENLQNGKDAAQRYIQWAANKGIAPSPKKIRQEMLKKITIPAAQPESYGFRARYNHQNEVAHELSHLEDTELKDSIFNMPGRTAGNPWKPVTDKDGHYFKGFIDMAYMDGNEESRKIGNILKDAWDSAASSDNQATLREMLVNAKAYEKIHKHLGKDVADRTLGSNLHSIATYIIGDANEAAKSVNNHRKATKLEEALFGTAVPKGKGRPKVTLTNHFDSQRRRGVNPFELDGYKKWHDQAESISAEANKKQSAKFKAMTDQERRDAARELAAHEEASRMEEYRRRAEEMHQQAKADSAGRQLVPLKRSLPFNPSVQKAPSEAPKKKPFKWWPFAVGGGLAAGGVGAGIAIHNRKKHKKVAAEKISMEKIAYEHDKPIRTRKVQRWVKNDLAKSMDPSEIRRLENTEEKTLLNHLLSKSSPEAKMLSYVDLVMERVKPQNRRLRIKSLHTTQATNNVLRLNDIYDNIHPALKSKDPVTVVRYKGKDILSDGNHRANALIKLKKDRISANYYDYDDYLRNNKALHIER